MTGYANNQTGSKKMNTVFIIIGFILVVAITFVVDRIRKFNSHNKRLVQKRFERITPLYDKLENGEPLTPEEVFPYAQGLLTREITFQLLADHGKLELFPIEYITIEKGAESNLANWLEFPTELDTCPNEIEHIKRVTFDFDGQNNLVHYEVFKYRTHEPHWAAKVGWILGVVGPYFDDSKAYDFPNSTFSRVGSTLEKISPEEEVKWVHKNISMKRIL
jgi:hypothetical protein